MTEFASYFGVSDAYTKLRYRDLCSRGWQTWNNVFLHLLSFLVVFLNSNFIFLFRYLSYVMDVSTPTADCLDLVHDLLLPVIIKGKSKNTLSHQEVGESELFSLYYLFVRNHCDESLTEELFR